MNPVLDCTSVEDANLVLEIIGCDGFFSNNFKTITKTPEKCPFGPLVAVALDRRPFCMGGSNPDGEDFRFKYFRACKEKK